jgi:hypothetical protein
MAGLLARTLHMRSLRFYVPFDVYLLLLRSSSNYLEPEDDGLLGCSAMLSDILHGLRKYVSCILLNADQKLSKITSNTSYTYRH